MSHPTTILEREIREQPEALARTMESATPAIKALVRDLAARDVHYLMIAARGSSDNAGIYAKYLFQAFNGLPVVMTTPSLYTFYHRPPKLRNVAVIAISQSGQSEDIVEVLADARAQGALTAAITAEPGSPLAARADHALMLQAGPEKAVAATKTFTASLAMLASLSAALEGSKERMDALRSLPELASQTIGLAADATAARAERYRYMQRCVVISRGFGYGIAMEIALKLKELTYVTAEPYSSADFMHGPMAMLEPGFPAILIATSGTLLSHMAEFGRTLRERGAEIVAISDCPQILDLGTTRLPFQAGAPEWMAPILATMPGQLLGLHLAIARGENPDAPRGLRKVTVTR
jgi:glucosamine--fructose-6-phosphate aminotransferase (isomerizing)